MRLKEKGKMDSGSRAGAVLMETVIAIPLFMVMLGGIFWIGELTVARQQLLLADRYLAWNKGMRHDDRGQTDAATLGRLFFADKSGAVTPGHTPEVLFAGITENYDWSHAAEGQASVKVEMPDWVYAMIHSVRIIYKGGGTMAKVAEVRGREREGQRHQVVMRTKAEADSDYIRNRYGVNESGAVTAKWKEISDEKWPYE
jgi:hypothetical protein